MTPPTSTEINASSVILPHLVYKLDFHKTEMRNGTDVLADIIKQSMVEFDKKFRKKEKQKARSL